jgi:hypothetical protein
LAYRKKLTPSQALAGAAVAIVALIARKIRADFIACLIHLAVILFRENTYRPEYSPIDYRSGQGLRMIAVKLGRAAIS